MAQKTVLALLLLGLELEPELVLVHTKSLHMLDMLSRSSKERISVEVLAGLKILEGLGVQIREELEVHSKIVKSKV